jgi:hypothetical protein
VHHKDYLRESPLRYWGYVNEFFESAQDMLRLAVGKEKAASWVRWSYGLVDKYVYVDAFDKGIKGFLKAHKEGRSKGDQLFSAVEQAGDAALFQTAASLYLPALMISVTRDYAKFGMMALLGNKQGVTDLIEELSHEAKNPHGYERLLANIKLGGIQRLSKLQGLEKWFVKRAVENPGTVSKVLTKGVPLAIGFGMIPFVVHPVDKFVNTVLDVTYRPAIGGLRKALFPQHENFLPANHPENTPSLTRHTTFHAMFSGQPHPGNQP